VSRWDSTTPLDAARRSEAADVVDWLLSLGAGSASRTVVVPHQEHD
jgi:hypothetical protein